MRWATTVLRVPILLLVMSLAEAVELSQIEVVGLFRDTTVLRVAGKQRLLKMGQLSPEGVMLVSASNSGAVISIEGKQYSLQLSNGVWGGYTEKKKSSELIAINAAGQYITQGSVNGQTVTFLVDTGATSVAINSRDARRLGIDFATAKPSIVATAGGPVRAYALTLDRVKVGEVEARNIRAVVLEGNYPTLALLGMTWLKHVEIVENAGVMKLTKKY